MAISAPARHPPGAAPVAAEIRVETVSDYRAFLEMEPLWNSVANAAGLDHPFLEHVWVRTWWECFGAGSRLQILVLKAGDETVAIAPLILTPIRMWGISAQRLGFFYNAHVPRADFLIAQRPKEVYRAIWRHLSRNRNWDLLQLCQLPQSSATSATLASLAAQDKCQTVTWQPGSSPYLPILGSWGKYYDGLATKHRANLRNRFKRLNDVGSVELETVTSGEDLAGALDAGLRLEASGWKGEARTAINCDPGLACFYETMAERAAERGWLRLHFLRAGARRVAFDYSLSYKGRLYLLKLGYDPEYSAQSPSNLLLYLVLQNTFERHDEQEYDFLGESGEWKLQWTRFARQHHWLFVFSNTFKGHLLHFIKAWIIPLLKRKSLEPLRDLALRMAPKAWAERT